MNKQYEHEANSHGYVPPKENLRIQYTHKLTANRTSYSATKLQLTETDAEITAVLLRALLGAAPHPNRFTWEYYEAREAYNIYQEAGLDVPAKYTEALNAQYATTPSSQGANPVVDTDHLRSLLGYDPKDRVSWECYEASAARRIYQEAGLEIPARYALPAPEIET